MSIANVVHTSTQAVLPKNLATKATVRAGVSTILAVKGRKPWGNCSTLQFCDVGGVWPVAIGHPCYGCNEEGIGFHKGIHQLAHVENQTPRSEKPDVNMKEGGNISAGAVGLLGGVVGLVAGVSVMAVRELGRQQKKDNADSRGE